jgi:hypothetical protein
MGLVRNLKKTLSKLAEKILVELSYHYIKQKAKQTSKRPDNFSRTESSQKALTTECQHSTIATSLTGTSEKITMETQIEPVPYVREWCIDRINKLADCGGVEDQFNAVALAAEFDEWINIPEGTQELDYLCLEDQDWTDEQEIDIR